MRLEGQFRLYVTEARYSILQQWHILLVVSDAVDLLMSVTCPMSSFSQIRRCPYPFFQCNIFIWAGRSAQAAMLPERAASPD
ncbi:hypothetical protein CY34DRAFT_803147 [Suillus luteus UH-Slu-Lm8-n1]|uniref:Uncharacterized protein n=1 Tax=Suillus luteus UH-Slu-Lm8-n1 TaxID=930992 RepID=A0A0D0AQN6_9AGAM|nr:hypothetical protein CY34DRAFT_803147 [Suillus luteus UH-Slu-Lm8-n1]